MSWPKEELRGGRCGSFANAQRLLLPGVRQSTREHEGACWKWATVDGLCCVGEDGRRWIMKGREREDEQSTVGAEERGCQGGAWGGMMWSKPWACTTIFAAALWIQTSRSRKPLQGVDIGWEVGIHGEMMMSPQITNRQAG